MNDPKQTLPDANRLRRMMTLCIGATIAGLIAIAIANIIPKSPTGGPDGPAMIIFLLLIGFLYIILPMHVIGAVATAYKYFFANNKPRFVLPLFYFVVWFVVLILYLILSGTAEPVFENFNRQKFESENKTEVQLLSALRLRNNEQAIPQLIGEVENIDLPDMQFGMTAIQWAAHQSSAEIMARLLMAGAEPNQIYRRSWTIDGANVLHPSVIDFAAWSKIESDEKVASLLSAGVQPSAQSLVGACNNGNLKVIDEILSDEIKLETAQEGNGLTCFHVAVANGNLELIRELLAREISPNVPSKYGVFPLDLALTEKQVRIATELLKAGAPAKHSGRLVELVINAPQEDLTQIVAHKPLATLSAGEAHRELSAAALGCDLTGLRRLIDAGLSTSADQLRTVRVPEHCEFRPAILQLIDAEIKAHEINADP